MSGLEVPPRWRGGIQGGVNSWISLEAPGYIRSFSNGVSL